ncbi:MAG: FeoB-associated Cys-rich membrane protein [Flavobacterium sp.]|nr:FeoB-associated Cys-rich membrane protein [Flavobacterium sp.]
MIQTVLVYIALAIAVFFILKPLFSKKKKNNCGDDNCGCN